MKTRLGSFTFLEPVLILAGKIRLIAAVFSSGYAYSLTAFVNLVSLKGLNRASLKSQ